MNTARKVVELTAHTTSANKNAPKRRDTYYDAVAKVVTFLSTRLDESLTLSHIASAAATSRFHFNRRFREVTGIPPCQFLYAMRMAEAKSRLLHTRHKVIDVCYDVGYNSLTTFTTRFTELVGVSPSRFRAQARKVREQATQLRADSSRFKRLDTDFGFSGEVRAPDNFQGFIFVALFQSALPQGSPVSCTILESSGHFHLGNIPDGDYRLFAMGIPKPLDESSLFHAPHALRAGGQQIIVCGERIEGAFDLTLRPPDPIDPPILIALHPLLVKRSTETVYVEPSHNLASAPAHG
jgi:AraC family transcriptional regulator